MQAVLYKQLMHMEEWGEATCLARNCMLGTDAMGKYGIFILFYFYFNDYFMVDFNLFQ